MERGGQPGNKNATKDKRIWGDAIRRAVTQQKGARLRSLAEKLITEAETGNVQAMKELGDRLDGKPAQIIAGSDDAPPIRARLEVVFVSPKS